MKSVCFLRFTCALAYTHLFDPSQLEEERKRGRVLDREVERLQSLLEDMDDRWRRLEAGSYGIKEVRWHCPQGLGSYAMSRLGGVAELRND